MMNLKGKLLLGYIGVVIGIMAACNPNKADLAAVQPASGQVAYLNLIPSSSAINFYVNGTRLNPNKIAYSEYSGYISVLSGERALLFKTDSLRNNLFDPVTLTLATDQTTLFITGNSAANLIAARDTAVADSKNYRPKLRFINASANSPAYDVVLNGLTISNTAANKISAFARVDTGKVVVSVKPTGSSTALIQNTFTFTSNRVYTLFVYGPYTSAATGLKYGVIINH